MHALSRQITCFVVVGCAAAATHWLVAVACVQALGMAPLAANAAGWLVAFGVSFGGHYLLTFRHEAAPLAAAAWRFFLISAAGFAINEATYAWLLAHTGLRYDVLLAGVLILVAGLTFLFSRYWAFRRTRAV